MFIRLFFTIIMLVLIRCSETNSSVTAKASIIPEKILKMLSPTDYEYAIKWRQDCRDYAEKKRKQKKEKEKYTPGTIIEFKDELEFGGNLKSKRFEIVDPKKNLFRAYFGRCRIKSWMSYEFDIIN